MQKKLIVITIWGLLAFHNSFAGSWIKKDLETAISESSLIFSGMVIRIEPNMLKLPDDDNDAKAVFQDLAIVMIIEVLKCDLNLEVDINRQPLQFEDLIGKKIPIVISSRTHYFLTTGYIGLREGDDAIFLLEPRNSEFRITHPIQLISNEFSDQISSIIEKQNK